MPVAENVRLGTNVAIFHPSLVNLYGCSIGDHTKIGSFVEIQKNAVVGARCKISSHSFVCEGVTIEDGVFVGHGVMFTNDRFPRATNTDGTMQTEADWKVEETLVRAQCLDRNQRNNHFGDYHRRGGNDRRRSGSEQRCRAICDCRRRASTSYR